MEQVTRRNFVAGAGIAAAAAGALGVSALAAEPSAKADAQLDGEYDVIVIGYGFAGGMAAISAADAGAQKVLLVDSAPEGEEGGNSRFCAQIVVYGQDHDELRAYYEGLGWHMDQDPDVLDAYVDGMVDQNGQPIARVNYGISGAHSEQYSLMGKPVKIVPDDILPAYDDAKGQAADTPCIMFMDLSNYIVNQQMGMRSVRWVDEDTNVIKQKVQTIVDGKMGDVNGTLIISAPKKGM